MTTLVLGLFVGSCFVCKPDRLMSSQVFPIFTSHLSIEALGLEILVPCVCLLIWVLGILTQGLKLAHSKHLNH